MVAYIRAALVGALIGAAALAFFLVLTQLSLGRGGEDKVAAAFAAGQLADHDFPRGNTVIGYNQHNDCLILRMALDQRASRAELTVSPLQSFRPGSSGLCNQLRSPPSAYRFFYHNYVHGQVMLVRFLLPVMEVGTIRELYRIAITLTVVGGLALSMLRIVEGRPEGAIFAVVLATFARAFGLESFGQSLGHGPSDLVFALLLLTLSLGRFSDRGLVLVAAIFGALTMAFELLTGGLPLGLAAILGLSWFALKDKSVRAVLAAAVSYCAAALATLAAKYAVVGVVFGWNSLLAIRSLLAVRMDGPIPGDAPEQSLASAILNGMESMMPGMGGMALSLLLVAIGFGGWAVARRPTPAGKLLAASTLPIVAWPFIFHEHMVLHAWFMDRMFAWIIAAGFALFVHAVMPAFGEAAEARAANEG